MFAFNHFNFNVTDLERSIAFYHDALGLETAALSSRFWGTGKRSFSWS